MGRARVGRPMKHHSCFHDVFSTVAGVARLGSAIATVLAYAIIDHVAYYAREELRRRVYEHT